VAKGLSLEDLRASLSIATADNPKGRISSGSRSFTIYTNDQLLQYKDWNDVIVSCRDGGALRVRDIGQAVTGPQDMTLAPGCLKMTRKTPRLPSAQAACVVRDRHA
jgi:HAE1 family hydrophobic/amphiphilic exporter-1